MSHKGISNSILIVLVITIVVASGYFIFFKKSSIPAGTQSQRPTQQIDTSNWKIYRNEKYGFEIKYPRDLEALEQDHTLPKDKNPIPLPYYYPKPKLNSLYSICFAPVNRTELSCEAELHVAPNFTASPQNLTFLNANTFLGFPRAIEEEKALRPVFDGVEGTYIPVIYASLGGVNSYLENAFVTRNDLLYLLVRLRQEDTEAPDQIFLEMTYSLKFLK